jgi:hypothetical protein
MEPAVKRTSPWVWVGLGCGIAVVGLVAFIAFIAIVAVGAMRHSTPYEEALHRAQNDPRVIALLGSPVTPGLFTSGSINTHNRDGDARLDIPLRGPKGKATLRVVGTKARGRWTYDQMLVTPKSGAEIDLLASPEGSTSTAPPGA